MTIIIYSHATYEASQHHRLLLAVVYAHLDRESAAHVGVMVEVDVAVLIPALGQVGAMLEYPVELHDGAEQTEGVEGHHRKVVSRNFASIVGAS